jgi:Amt family ammonium transporter
VGLFSDGTLGQGLNGIGKDAYLGVAGQGVSGIALLAPGLAPDTGQLIAQVLGLLVIVVLALGPGWLIFRLGSIRPSAQE